MPLCSDVRICAVADEDEGAVQQTSFSCQNSEESKKIAENKKQSERKTFRLFFVYVEKLVSCVYESSPEAITDGRESYH